ncbi:MAG: M20/M25/M40 family metallo-hydrolase [Acidobacteria bacterium]|nr:M20/M25/M40 family metallo-hydrolase [Acidobacteriota bacterium]MBV9477153.1 M20/M25/M40 family metallo-hydrolase [Acidobacteriota bacterium]
MKSVVALLLLVFVPIVASAATPREAAQAARTWRTAHEREIVAELTSLLALPNLASDATNIERNAQAIVAMLARRGITANVLRIDGVPPLIVADVNAPHATTTIGFYAHYDGQPVDATQWRNAPWQPVLRDANGHDVANADKLDPEWRVYARSASDDKGSIVGMLAALDALRAAKLAPSVNLKFVFEGEEEAGSPNLGRYLAEHARELAVDAWMICDGPVHQSRRMQVLFGARGTTDLELTVYGPARPLHSGHYGNWAPNPIVMLAELLAQMRDSDGRILIPGFYDDVRPLTDVEKEALARAPNPDDQLRAELALGRTEGDGKKLNELVLQPALNLRGFVAGHVGAQASNTIVTDASASIDFRLVPDETPESVRARVEQFLVSKGWFLVRDTPDAATRAAHPRVVKLAWGAGYPPARTAMDLPLSRRVLDVIAAGRGEAPVALPTIGGSVPMYLFQGAAHKPAIVIPIANHDNNQHAANENLRLQNLWDGIEVYASLFAGLR